MFLTIAGAAAVWAVIAGICLLVGSTGNNWPGDPSQFAYRLDRVLTASLIGGALAAAGVVYQAILRNPLADPYLLGVSSGAALFAYVWRQPMAVGLLAAVGLAQTAVSQQVFAFMGALGAVAIVFLVSMRRGRLEPLTLLLVGVIVNVIAGALFLLVNILARDSTTQTE